VVALGPLSVLRAVVIDQPFFGLSKAFMSFAETNCLKNGLVIACAFSSQRSTYCTKLSADFGIFPSILLVTFERRIIDSSLLISAFETMKLKSVLLVPLTGNEKLTWPRGGPETIGALQ
jgi:hypothetical protein